jgi:hypothetical protein
MPIEKNITINAREKIFNINIKDKISNINIPSISANVISKNIIANASGTTPLNEINSIYNALANVVPIIGNDFATSLNVSLINLGENNKPDLTETSSFSDKVRINEIQEIYIQNYFQTGDYVNPTYNSSNILV